MNRDWLIRTKNNHILGPVSREKVLELLEKSYIKGDDEICSGNGYWFFVREADLVKKFLVDKEVQPFNPVSEVVASEKQGGPSVLAHPGVVPQKVSAELSQDPQEISLPSSSDLEYPDDLTSAPDYDSHGEADEEEDQDDEDDEEESSIENILAQSSTPRNVVPLKQTATPDPLDTPAPKYKNRERPKKEVVQAPASGFKKENLTNALLFLIFALILLAGIFRKQLWPMGL